MTEKIVTCASTGGQKGAKPEAYSMLPWQQLREVAKVYSFGAEKYEPYNWCRGYDWSLSFSSLIRHAEQFWSGQDIDEESGLPHLAHAVFHCLALLYFMENHQDLDDRHIPPTEEKWLTREEVNVLTENMKKAYK